ncbi:hypothetical protein D3C75_1321600 [compost metagenome]
MDVDMVIRRHRLSHDRAGDKHDRRRRQRGGEFQTHLKILGKKKGPVRPAPVNA